MKIEERIEIPIEDFLSLLDNGEELLAKIREAGFVKTKEFDDSLTLQFYQIWKGFRRKNSIPIPKNSPIPQIEKATWEAVTFCKEFGFKDLREGFIVFCENLFELKVIKLYQIPFKGEKVSMYYSDKIKIAQDDNTQLTKRLMDLYSKLVLEGFGYIPKLSKRDRVYFVGLSSHIWEKKIEPEEYLVNLFDKYSWMETPFNLSLLWDEKLGTLEKPIVRKVIIKKGFNRYD